MLVNPFCRNIHTIAQSFGSLRYGVPQWSDKKHAVTLPLHYHFPKKGFRRYGF